MYSIHCFPKAENSNSTGLAHLEDDEQASNTLLLIVYNDYL